ncbi:FeoA family protein [Prosthecochloris sp. GSB1]|uniref:FeoA family protein n=1 Tax=Prosthecochloris sp. GSB1 TaxID=281093 RepID=UPI00123763E6|nr:FeoA family protein [Prosthecochloris sp. GSB1]
MKTLSELHEGMSSEIRGMLCEGRHRHGCHSSLHLDGAVRLREMGFCEGQRITVLRNRGNGPLVVKLQESRMVLGRGLAKKILIGNNT